MKASVEEDHETPPACSFIADGFLSTLVSIRDIIAETDDPSTGGMLEWPPTLLTFNLRRL